MPKGISLFHYRIAQGASWLVSKAIFHCRCGENALRGVQGPYVVIANHQAALDFVNLITATSRPMSFVISRSFFSTLPVKGFMEKMGVIPKQQFQTTAADLKKMKRTVEAGTPVVIYPAGLMCEDGISTPIPLATYKLLKWLGVDVYMARTQGAYFVMPKWGKGFRPGRTDMQIYKLFDAQQLQALSLEQIRDQTDRALHFDAYREQERRQCRYWGSKLDGLEHVLYQCPQCAAEFSIGCRKGRTLFCSQCGFEVTADSAGLFSCPPQQTLKLRYASDWSRQIHNDLRHQLQQGQMPPLRAATAIYTIHAKRHKYILVGQGTLRMDGDRICLEGTVGDQPLSIQLTASAYPILPFKPGRYLELQDGGQIYRCVLEDGRLVMKFIHRIKANFEIASPQLARLR